MCIAGLRLGLLPGAGRSSGAKPGGPARHLRTHLACICPEEDSAEDANDFLSSCRPRAVQLSQVANWNLTMKLSEVLIICHILECIELIYFLHVHLLMSF